MEVSLPEQVQVELEEGSTGIELARKIKKTLSGTPLALLPLMMRKGKKFSGILQLIFWLRPLSGFILRQYQL